MRGVLAALVLSAVFAASASAAPAWKFDGQSTGRRRNDRRRRVRKRLTIPGLTTKCENFLYKLTIENSGGTGKGSLTELPLYNCTTDSKYCTVKTIGAETLPWPAKLTKVEPSNYIVIEGVKVAILYAGELCALGGHAVKVTGTAGGLLDNVTETATFNAASFTATKTELKALAGRSRMERRLPDRSIRMAQRTGADGLLAPKAKTASAGIIPALAVAALLALGGCGGGSERLNSEHCRKSASKRAGSNGPVGLLSARQQIPVFIPFGR